MKLVNFIQKTLSSVFFLGYFPFMSGTIGSAIIVAGLWYLQTRMHVVFSPQQWWLAIIAMTALSIILSSRPQEVFGKNDPGQIIVDECAGQLITFFFVPLAVNNLILGFLLFRFFDIVKPYPIHKMEELEGGLGITMDDVMAGVFANISLMTIHYGYHVVKAAL